MKYVKAKYADLLGVVSSVICLLHCLLLPLLWVWLSSFTVESWHLLDYIFMAFAGIAVFFSARHAAFSYLKIGLWVSFIIFAVPLTLHDTLANAHYFSLAGSMALILCHIVNFRFHLQHHHS